MRARTAGGQETDILRQGLAAFVELGYDATSTRLLAKRLDVSHNFINDRYGSKAEFWEAAGGYALERMRERLTDVLDTDFDDDAKRLTALVRRFYREIALDPGLNRVLVLENTQNSRRANYLQEQYAAPMYTALAPCLNNLMTAGRIPRAPKRLYFLAVMGPISALMNQ
ncbi:TetR/AcrR family transcriptional regulator [Spirillospora sp. NPDC000708]